MAFLATMVFFFSFFLTNPVATEVRGNIIFFYFIGNRICYSGLCQAMKEP